jgi:threonylcarbamoyladenosine tRNA methylthiotransferase MtaB
LTGVNIGHYGMTPIDSKEAIASDKYWQRSKLYAKVEGHPSLFDLIDAVLARLPEGHRLRISSIEPEDIEARFFEQLSHPRMCPHLHLPLQSGSDKVLGDMRRLYDSREYMRIVADFRRVCPAGALSTDIIVGYPSEGADHFDETLALCEAAQFERIHGFPFSPRQGTRAAMLPQLPRETVLERNRRLIAHCSRIADARWARFVGSSAQLLIEEQHGGEYFGHGEAYQLVRISGDECDANLAGRIVDVSLDSYNGEGFSGSLLNMDVMQLAGARRSAV